MNIDENYAKDQRDKTGDHASQRTVSFPPQSDATEDAEDQSPGGESSPALLFFGLTAGAVGTLVATGVAAGIGSSEDMALVIGETSELR